MKSKLSTLKEYAAAGDWDKAIAIAAKFPRLGGDRDAVLNADMAVKHPAFCRAVKKDPALLRAAGISAIKRKYGI